ncbi:hypothetical protein NEDG_02022 [Nematocida displodere]|uniref:Uncharacterized protein n=1 Tax=Nematocida displodere TaxID=1805483 RepID=A0A177EGE4_9MICR|nr:hypothetical protein NEDG_02022 [Nematocida displodere]
MQRCGHPSSNRASPGQDPTFSGKPSEPLGPWLRAMNKQFAISCPPLSEEQKAIRLEAALRGTAAKEIYLKTHFPNKDLSFTEIVGILEELYPDAHHPGPVQIITSKHRHNWNLRESLRDQTTHLRFNLAMAGTSFEREFVPIFSSMPYGFRKKVWEFTGVAKKTITPEDFYKFVEHEEMIFRQIRLERP